MTRAHEPPAGDGGDRPPPEPLCRPTSDDLVGWLAATPMTAALGADLRTADGEADVAADSIEGRSPHSDPPALLVALARASDELRAHRAAVAAVLERASHRPPEPLPIPHARTLADAVQLETFLRTASGRTFLDWFRAAQPSSGPEAPGGPP